MQRENCMTHYNLYSTNSSVSVCNTISHRQRDKKFKLKIASSAKHDGSALQLPVDASVCQRRRNTEDSRLETEKL